MTKPIHQDKGFQNLLKGKWNTRQRSKIKPKQYKGERTFFMRNVTQLLKNAPR